MITLRIKKKFFDQIVSGEKITEFRSFSNYYKNLFSKNPTYLKLHYQEKIALIVEISKIEIYSKQETGFESEFITTEKYFKIELGRVYLTV